MGTTVARLVAENISTLEGFDPTVRMYSYDEQIDFQGEKQSIVKVINEHHINPKYLPDIPLPHTILSVGNVTEACQDCDYIIIVTPHQFFAKMIPDMRGHLAPNATAITLIKGVTVTGDRIELITDAVQEGLGIPCGALMGANIANDIARGDFCESTIAFEDEAVGQLWYPIFNNKNFRIKVIKDVVLTQLCGTLKNIVATAVGFVAGLGYGESTKAAFIRVGMEETFKFAQWYFPDKGCSMETLLESCGVADFVATSYGGRNQKCAIEFVKTGKDIFEIEKELLNGQKLQGVVAAKEIYELLSTRGELKQFPLLVTVHLIATKQVPPATILEYDGPHLDNLK